MMGSVDRGKAWGMMSPRYLGLEGLGLVEVGVRGFRFRCRGGIRMHHFNVFHKATFVEVTWSVQDKQGSGT